MAPSTSPSFASTQVDGAFGASTSLHVTTSGVQAVEGDARLAELARMMAGSDSNVARDHAAQLRADAGARVEALTLAAGSARHPGAAPAAAPAAHRPVAPAPMT